MSYKHTCIFEHYMRTCGEVQIFSNPQNLSDSLPKRLDVFLKETLFKLSKKFIVHAKKQKQNQVD